MEHLAGVSICIVVGFYFFTTFVCSFQYILNGFLHILELIIIQ
jgi:hypothetical protein